jgi:hypothetical protein
MNCHSESENFLKFLLTCANFSRFNPGDVSWIKPFQETSPGDFGIGICWSEPKKYANNLHYYELNQKSP